MSLFGALDTAISGLGAQSSAFGNISDSVANSQTVGFKRVDTSFIDYLTTSTPTDNQSGAVVARPDYVNTAQGTVTQSTNPLALAIGGSGFFAASQPNGQTQAGQPTFNPQTYYTRAGDFQQDKNGFLVNSAGLYLNGWAANADGTINQNALAPIQVSQASLPPQATLNVNIAANLPATPAPGVTIAPQIEVYDSLGNAHNLSLNWTPPAAGSTTPNTWVVDVKDGTTDLGAADVTFNDGTTTGTIAGTPASIVMDGTDGGTVAVPATAGTVATFSITPTFATAAGGGLAPQTININLGNFNQSTGVTQFAGTQYAPTGLTQDGATQGNYTGVTLQSTGDVVVGYDNGKTRTIAQIPVVTFANANALQRQNGQSFTATDASGAPLSNNASANGAGHLVTSSVESSNVDLASELSNLIVAQQAYSANAKVVTSANQLLQVTLDMKQ